MESHNLIKDCSKDEEQQSIHHVQHQSKRPLHGKRLLLYLAASAILVVTVLLAITVAGLLNGSSNKVDENKSSSLKGVFITVCNVTLYSNLCISSLSSSWNQSYKADPESILKLSLHVSSEGLSNTTSVAKNLSSTGTDAGNSSTSEAFSAAVNDCLDVLDEASDKVKDSLNQMEEVGLDGKVLNATKVNNIRTWISAAMTNQQTCLDELQDISPSDEGTNDSPVVFKRKMELSKQLLSNSLAIVSHMDDLLMKFSLKMY